MLQADARQVDALQADALQADALQLDALQLDARQLAAQAFGSSQPVLLLDACACSLVIQAIKLGDPASPTCKRLGPLIASSLPRPFKAISDGISAL